jgi:Protein of unknown function (DUF4236)
MQFEIEGNAAIIRLPEHIQDVRVFMYNKRVDIARSGDDVQTTVSERQPSVLETVKRKSAA